MTLTLKSAIVIFTLILFACNANQDRDNHKPYSKDSIAVALEDMLEFSISTSHNENDTVLLRIAFIGDAEPKPLPEFPGMKGAVQHINKLTKSTPVDFVIGIGDIAHKGTKIQYEEATKVLQMLDIPIYPIMGNEEHESTIERYLQYAKKWNENIQKTSYVINHEKVAFVLASPDHGRDFNDSGVLWIAEQLKRLAPKPVFLIVHGAQTGVYPENNDKGISNQLFKKQVIGQPNLCAVISGDLHMDMDRVNHSKKIDQIHYLHIPALERTKIPDKTNHTPMFRVMTISKNGAVKIDTYTVGKDSSMEEHQYIFSQKLQP